MKLLVVGATGATGRHVVKQLLEEKHSVAVIVRSRDRMIAALGDTPSDNLTITEASLLDLSDSEIKEHVKGVDVVVQTLGHNMDFKGMYGHPRKLVTDAAKRITQALGENQKFVMMGTDGYAHPEDDPRSFTERSILTLLRWLVPPVSDNEDAADYLRTVSDVEWTVVRPTDLVDGEVSEYTLFDKPVGSLFGGGVATRSNVAKAMVDIATTPSLWEKYKFHMPVVHDKLIEKKEEL